MNDKKISKIIDNNPPDYVLKICNDKSYKYYLDRYELWDNKDGHIKLILSTDSKEEIKINLDIRNLKMYCYSDGFDIKLWHLYYKENC